MTPTPEKHAILDRPPTALGAATFKVIGWKPEWPLWRANLS